VTRLGRLFALIAALGGFAAAHVVTQSGQAMELPPITSVTTVLPTLPLPPPPTTALPPPPTTVLPPPPTTTVPLPVPVPPLPLPPVPTVTTVPILPAPLPPPQTGTLPRIPPPAPAPSGTPAPASPPTLPSSTPPSASSGSSGAGSATAGSGTTTGSTARSQRLRASERRTARRISVRLAFTLAKAGRIFLVVRGPAPSCRVAGVIPVRGRRGANTVYFAGRVHGRHLEPGLYLISLSPRPRVDADAPAELVRVVSGTRSVPAPDSVPRPACSTAETPGETAARILVRETPPTPPTVRPAAPLRPPLQGSAPEDGDDDSAGFLPIPAALEPDTGTEAVAAIALVMLVGALLLAMVALVTRFVRGSWNP
jgi:hypothetical protein